jgi:hypothetical protein
MAQVYQLPRPADNPVVSLKVAKKLGEDVVARRGSIQSWARSQSRYASSTRRKGLDVWPLFARVVVMDIEDI